MLVLRVLPSLCLVCFELSQLAGADGPTSGPGAESGPKRVLSEILSIFTPGREVTLQSPTTTESALLPPYGLNRAWSQLGKDVGDHVDHEAAGDTRQTPSAAFQIAKGVMDLLNLQVSTPATTTTTTPGSFFERLSNQVPHSTGWFITKLR